MPTIGFRALALAAALSAWALVAVGGVVRVTESGLGCPDWPLCDGNVVPAGRQSPAIEFSHRATATIVTLLVVAVAVWGARAYWRSRRDIVVPALAAAAFVPFQALLGAVVVWLELPPWVVAVHFLLGMLFLATTAVTAARASYRRVYVPVVLAQTTRAAAVAALALISLGASVVAAHADTACGREWPACNGALARGGSLAQLQVAHRLLAYLVALLAVGLAALAWRSGGPRLAATLPLLAVVGQISVGVALVLARDGGSAHDALEILHVAGAGTVWALLVALLAIAAVPQPSRSHTSRLAAAAGAG